MTIPDSHRAPRTRRAATRACATLVALACLTPAALVHAQQPPQPPQQQTRITPNFRDTDLSQVVDAVSSVTGKTFIIDPRVRAQVTMLNSTPMTPDELYEVFLSILQVHGFVAVPAGNNVVKIIPDANLRAVPANDLPERVSSTSDEIVTQVIQVRNVNAQQLVPILRPLLPQQAHLVASQTSNVLIISDRAANVNRIMRIIQRIDQAGDQDIDVIRLQNASAAEIVRVVNSLFSGPGAQPEAPGMATRVVADDRTNSVLISGEPSQRLRMKTLITHLDTPLEDGGDTQVRYLEYADAEQLASKLNEQVQGLVRAAGGAPQGGQQGGGQRPDTGVAIWADPQNNALVITAPPKIMRQIMSIVDKLDIRRAQVLVEAILVEISTNRMAELGVNWAIDGTGDSSNTVPIGTFNQPVGNVSIGSLASALLRDSDDLDPGLLPTGLTLGAGRFRDTGVNFAVLLRALRGDSSTNILQTPQIITLDNEEAEIRVAQEVPFITGQFTSTGTVEGTVNPFTTVQRQEVGTILKITPQINRGVDTVLLNIQQESSNLAASTQGAVDLITNKRTISTKVMVEDGGIIVLGGLISDEARESEQRVPILGSVPILGELFKTRSGSKDRQNLMVFIRPTILRDGVDAAIETNAKYNVMRNQQLARPRSRVTLLPSERPPVLPPIEELSRYADPTQGGTPPQPGTVPPDPEDGDDSQGTETAPLEETEPPEEAPPEEAPPPQ